MPAEGAVTLAAELAKAMRSLNPRWTHQVDPQAGAPTVVSVCPASKRWPAPGDLPVASTADQEYGLAVAGWRFSVDSLTPEERALPSPDPDRATFICTECQRVLPVTRSAHLTDPTSKVQLCEGCADRLADELLVISPSGSAA